MICSPARPARCSTCGCSSSQSSTSGTGKCTANCLAPTTSNFRLDFFALLWYLMAIAALLFQRKVLIPDSIRVRAESRYFLFQVSTKGGTTSKSICELFNCLNVAFFCLADECHRDRLCIGSAMQIFWYSVIQHFG